MIKSAIIRWLWLDERYVVKASPTYRCGPVADGAFRKVFDQTLADLSKLQSEPEEFR